jgi:glycosyltransferase involved in cell wall biosynthesis
VRVLLLIHDYLPLHAAGSEIYTAHLAAALKARGHEVAVFTCEERRDLPQYELTERVHDDVPVFEAIYNRIYHDLSEQWDDPRMAEVLDGVLARFAPDVVHVQGLQFVGGTSALKAVAVREIPILVTLHEYWWLCPRAGLMFDLDGRACETASSRDCARCVDIYPIDRERWSDQACAGAHDDLGDRRWFARALDQRALDLAAARELVSTFIAPSRFLGERMVAAGFPAERVVVSDYGFPPAPRPARAPAGSPLRVGFVGTLSDYKGPLVLARAAARASARTERLSVTIHGNPDWFPEVGDALKELEAATPCLTLPGPFDPSERERVFASLDVLVVPSLWWENSPLTIHEAFQRGVPVLTSDLGGMAELVSEGGGLTFPPGDDAALAELLVSLAEEPARVDALASAIPPVRDVAQDAGLVEQLTAAARG